MLVLVCRFSVGSVSIFTLELLSNEIVELKIDPRSCERNLCNCVKKPGKNSGPQRDLKP